MRNVHDYLAQNGDTSFVDVPFGAADSFCLCHGFYMPALHPAYEAIGKKEVSFSEMALKSFDLWGGKYRKVGVVLSGQVCVTLVKMARSRRFSEAKVLDFTEVFRPEPAVQFSAMTLLLPDGTVVVAFRGTDDSLIGWKEDLDILVKKGMPSHELAVDCLEKAASLAKGPIVVCGHSKGGNLALSAALECSEETRRRIRTVYNLEGPGFWNYDLYGTKAYRDILPRYVHLVPTGSFIGMFLAHDEDFRTVRNGTFFGPLEHDLNFWLIKNGEPDYGKGLSLQGKLNKAFLRRFTEFIPEEYFDTIDKVATGLVRGAGQLYLTGMVQNLGSTLRGMASAWRSFDKDTRSDFITAFSHMPSAISGAVKDVATELRPAKPEEEDAPAAAPVPVGAPA